MRTFDHSDFTRNPGKYELFKTAVIARPVISEPTFEAGTVVSLSFYAVRRNQLFRRDEPIYAISANGRTTWVFAHALGDFVL